MIKTNNFKLGRRLQKLIRLNNNEQAIELAEKYNCILVFDDVDSNDVFLLLNSNSKLFIELRENLNKRLLTLNPEIYKYIALVDLISIDKFIMIHEIDGREIRPKEFYEEFGVN